MDDLKTTIKRLEDHMVEKYARIELEQAIKPHPLLKLIPQDREKPMRREKFSFEIYFTAGLLITLGLTIIYLVLTSKY